MQKRTLSRLNPRRCVEILLHRGLWFGSGKKEGQRSLFEAVLEVVEQRCRLITSVANRGATLQNDLQRWEVPVLHRRPTSIVRSSYQAIFCTSNTMSATKVRPLSLWF